MAADMNQQAIRADVVGSLLRPAEIIEARRAFETGRISQGALGMIEDRHILEAIALQERAGVDVVTDGEFRRSTFAGQFPAAVAGVVFVEVQGGLRWKGGDGEAASQPRRQPGHVAGRGRLRPHR